MLSRLSSFDTPPDVTLDFGPDGAACGLGAVEMAGCGMCFRAARPFDLGTTLEVSVRDTSTCDEPPLDLEAMVVDCREVAARCYETVVWFLDGTPASGARNSWA